MKVQFSNPEIDDIKFGDVLINDHWGDEVFWIYLGTHLGKHIALHVNKDTGGVMLADDLTLTNLEHSSVKITIEF